MKGLRALAIFFCLISFIGVAASHGSALGVVIWGWVAWDAHRGKRRLVNGFLRVLLGIQFLLGAVAIIFLFSGDQDSSIGFSRQELAIDWIVSMLMTSLGLILSRNVSTVSTTQDGKHFVTAIARPSNLTPTEGSQEVGLLPPIQRGASQEAIAAIKNEHSDEVLWELAAKELASGNRREGLWAKSFAEANGDEALARANYLKSRFRQIQNAPAPAVEEDLAPRAQVVSYKLENRPTTGAKDPETDQKDPPNLATKSSTSPSFLWILIFPALLILGLLYSALESAEKPKIVSTSKAKENSWGEQVRAAQAMVREGAIRRDKAAVEISLEPLENAEALLRSRGQITLVSSVAASLETESRPTWMYSGSGSKTKYFNLIVKNNAITSLNGIIYEIRAKTCDDFTYAKNMYLILTFEKALPQNERLAIVDASLPRESEAIFPIGAPVPNYCGTVVSAF